MFRWLSEHNIPATFPTNRLRKLRETNTYGTPTHTHTHTHTTQHTRHGELIKLFIFCENKTWAKIREYTQCTVHKA